ncbi:hypothetical protein ACFSW8_06250 [Rubritalea tangerina]|uniref:Uncharacterized protein n=1 Tax=Rubritalea tangerina TaxID=430798 RepID=A0ABW4Z9F1_9BACT
MSHKGTEVPDRKTTGGVWFEIQDEKLVNQSTRILPNDKQLFGIRYIVTGPKKHESIELVNTVEFPSGMVIGGKAVYESQFTSHNTTDYRIPSLYSFDDSPITSGPYTFKVSMRGVTLLTKTLKIDFV